MLGHLIETVSSMARTRLPAMRAQIDALAPERVTASETDDTAGIDVILVPQSAYDAFPENPDPLVDAVVGFVNTLTNQGRFVRSELPADALAMYHCDDYLAQVTASGHAHFVGSIRLMMQETVADVQRALRILGADDHAALAQAMADWISRHPGDARRQTGLGKGSAPQLQDLDKAFRALNDATPLRPMIAQWIARHKRLAVVPDARLDEALEDMCNANPKRNHRNTVVEISQLDRMFTDPALLSLNVACGKMDPPAQIMSIGAGFRMPIGSHRPRVHIIQTPEGRLLGAVNRKGALLFACEGGSARVANVLTAEDLEHWTPPEIGDRLARIDIDDITMARLCVRKLQAAAAVHLLCTHLPQPARIDWATIRNAGTDPRGRLRMMLDVVLNKGRMEATAKLTTEEARLISEDGSEEFACVPIEAVAAYAKAHASDVLLAD